MDDVFDEDADELTVNKNEFNKIIENIEKVKCNFKEKVLILFSKIPKNFLMFFLSFF